MTTREPLRENLAVALERGKNKAREEHSSVELKGLAVGRSAAVT